jgi:hypothetical protein
MTDKLLDALCAITGSGGFHSTGTAPFFLPGLHVDGLGEIAFPLPSSQAKELVALAEAAPYGMGSKTVLDEKVRKCWQLDASRFKLTSPQWSKFIKETVARVREDLGIAGKISAHPYKLLVYGKGGHFKAHRDTEKLDAMFGTLIVALPSAHTGGRLFIRHHGQEIEIDFSAPQHRDLFQHAAFFADCEHEVEPVRSGYRCCLVFNLRLDKGDAGSLNLSPDAHALRLLDPLRAMKEQWRGRLAAVLMEHQYTEANFGLRKLKGNDSLRANALFAAAKAAGLTARLGLVTYHQSGELVEDYRSHRSRHRHWQEDDETPDGTMGEIHDESLTIDHWRSASDRAVPLGSYHINQDVILSREPIGEGDPDEMEAEGYTGNAGCTMDYWYRRAAVVLWAKEDEEKILCQYNFPGACRELAKLADAKKGSVPGSAFHRLGKAVIALLPGKLPSEARFSHGMSAKEGPFALTLGALAKTRSRELLDELVPLVPDPAWALCDAAMWKKLHKVFGLDAFEDLYGRMIAGDPDAQRHILFPILDALLAAKGGEAQARTFAMRLCRLKPKPPMTSCWEKKPEPVAPGDRGETRIMIVGLRLLDHPEDRAAAMDFLLADRSLDYVRQVLVPALLDNPPRLMSGEPFTFARDLLAAEVSRPLPPYPDWTRPCPLPDAPPRNTGFSYHRGSKTREALCELAAFMADPAARTHEFRHPQDIRSTLESYIRDHFLDIDHITVRKGSPHSLACTKNDKSYHRALARRLADEKQLKQLSAINPE